MTDSDETALLRTICDEPGDDAPRLIYADWLDDHARPEQAAYIRSEVARAGLPDGNWPAPGEPVMPGPPVTLPAGVDIHFSRGLPAYLDFHHATDPADALAELADSGSALARLPLPADWSFGSRVTAVGAARLADIIRDRGFAPVISGLVISDWHSFLRPILEALPGLRQFLTEMGDWTDEDSAVLAGLPELRELFLADCHGLTDAGLEPLRHTTRLEALSLRGCLGLTDDALRHIAGLPLRELAVSGALSLTSDAMRPVAGLTGLRGLSIGRTSALDDAALPHLAGLTALEELRLHGNLSGRGVHLLAGLTRLRHLSLPGGDEFLLELPHFPELETLDLHEGSAITTLRLHDLPRLTAVTLRRPRLSRVDFRGLLSLKSFSTGGAYIAPDGLAGLAGAPGLTALSLSDCGPQFTDAGLTRLSACPELASLSILHCDGITGTTPDVAAGLSRLKRVSLGGCPNLTRLETFAAPALSELVVEACPLLDDAFAVLAGLSALLRLELIDCVQLTTGAVPYLARLTGLRSLRVAGCPGVDLAAVTELRRLLPECEVNA